MLDSRKGASIGVGLFRNFARTSSDTDAIKQGETRAQPYLVAYDSVIYFPVYKYAR